MPQKVDKYAWVDGAAARPHHQAFQRRKTHRGIDAHAVTDRRHRRAIPQMGNNEPQVPPADHLLPPARAIRMAQSVEAVAADAPFARPFLGHRIGSGGLGQGCMESSVECCHLWNVRAGLAPPLSMPSKAGRVVERRQLCQFFDRPLDLRRDPHGGGVALAAMDNAMSHGSELFERRAERRRWASLQIVEDASGRVSVFLQLQFLADFRLARSAEN